MTIPPVIRIFFAIDLQQAVKKHLALYSSQLKKNAKSNSIRWTQSENLHVTLAFLAEFSSAHLTKLCEEVRSRLQGIASSAIHLGGLQLFPSPYRPRVIVLELKEHDRIAAIAQLINEAIAAINYPVETRPFRGHLTLGRIKQPQGIDLKFLDKSKMPEIEPITLDQVVLFRSEPQAHGSKYTLLASFMLE